ncbi:ubiquitin-activating enzyme, partial [Entamoeba histolytica HM-3:IMSS]
MDTYSVDTLSSSFVHLLNKEEQLELLVGFNYAPVNSVIGSLAAQEVINIIGKRPTYTNEDSN